MALAGSLSLGPPGLDGSVHVDGAVPSGSPIPCSATVSVAVLDLLSSASRAGSRLARVVGRRLRADADSISLRLPPAARFLYLAEVAAPGGFSSPATPGGFVGWLSVEQLVELSGGDASHACRVAAEFEAGAPEAPWLVASLLALKVADRVSLNGAGDRLSVAPARMFLVRWAGAAGGDAGGVGSWEFEADLQLLDPTGFERAAAAFFAQWRPPADAILDVRRSLLGSAAAAVTGGAAVVRPLLAALMREEGGSSGAAAAPPSVGALAAAAAAALTKLVPPAAPALPAGAQASAAAATLAPAAPVTASSSQQPPAPPPPPGYLPRRGAGPDLGVYTALRDSTDPDDVLKWAFEAVRRLRGQSLLNVRSGAGRRGRPPRRHRSLYRPARLPPPAGGDRGAHDTLDALCVAEPPRDPRAPRAHVRRARPRVAAPRRPAGRPRPPARGAAHPDAQRRPRA